MSCTMRLALPSALAACRPLKAPRLSRARPLLRLRASGQPEGQPDGKPDATLKQQRVEELASGLKKMVTRRRRRRRQRILRSCRSPGACMQSAETAAANAP